MSYTRLQDDGSKRKGDGDSGADSNKPADSDSAAGGDGAAGNDRTSDGNISAVCYGYSVPVQYADGNAGNGADRSTDEGADACSDSAGESDSGAYPGAECHTVRKADKPCYGKSGADIDALSDQYAGSDRGTGLCRTDTERLAADRGLLREEGGLFSGYV